MRFSLFVHMERVSDQQTQKQLYDEMIELCQIADQGGMHAIWTGEHHAMNFTIAPNPFINLADIANKTKNVRLGTGTVVAPFWHPIKLAGEAAMTDIISNGRLDIGIARGAYSFEYERMVPGMDAWGAGQRLREMIPAVKNLWKGDYQHNGEFWQFPKTTSAPQPVIIFTTPAGNPASCTKRAKASKGAGPSSDALSTILQPAANAGPTFTADKNNWLFHGTIAAITPTGSRIVHACISCLSIGR